MREIVLTGTVVHGKKEASALGYPTANIAYASFESPVMEPGVYAAHVVGVGTDDPHRGYAAAVVIGGDFNTEPPLKLEAHVLDLSGVDLYGQQLTVRILEKIRPLQHFENIDDLKKQIAQDIDAIRRFFYTNTVSSA